MSHCINMIKNKQPNPKVNKNKEIFLVSLTLIVLFFAYTLLYQPTKVAINQVTTSDLSYGNTVLTGVLIKDSPVGKDGKYLLALPDMRTILLTADRLDDSVGKTVQISGLLSPALDSNTPMVMVVNEIITKE